MSRRFAHKTNRDRLVCLAATVDGSNDIAADLLELLVLCHAAQDDRMEATVTPELLCAGVAKRPHVDERHGSVLKMAPISKPVLDGICEHSQVL